MYEIDEKKDGFLFSSSFGKGGDLPREIVPT